MERAAHVEPTPFSAPISGIAGLGSRLYVGTEDGCLYGFTVP